jgi:hypothetical protein
MEVQMKVIGFIEIGGYQIFTSAKEASADPEATKAEIAKQEGIDIDQVLELDNYEELFEKKKIYFRPGPNQINMEDPEADPLIEKFKSLNENQLLTLTGQIIPNYIDTEYYAQENGKWKKIKIEHVGEIPCGPKREELAPEQLEEIRAQEETERKIKMQEEERQRICCMTPEERAEALQRELDALADEAAKLEKRAHIQGNDFDPVAWYQEHSTAVRNKYTVEERQE